MYVEWLEITNFRCIAHAAMDLNYPGRIMSPQRLVPTSLPNVNLFIGENGSGKSSVFKSSILAILGDEIAFSGFHADYLVRRVGAKKNTNAEVSSIRAKALFAWMQDEDDEEIELWTEISMGRESDRVSDWNSSEGMTLGDLEVCFIAGYGTNRRTERPEGYSEGNRSPRYQRVASLFEEHVGMVPFGYGCLQLSRRNLLDFARNLLNSLIPNYIQLTDKWDDRGRDELLFERRGVLLPFSALSDGFRAFVGWVWDMMVQIARVLPKGKWLTDLPGVVIVDEIDLFLHPEWQRRVVPAVAEAFPNLQFLFSTHSPLVALTLEPAHIFVMGEDAEGWATVEQYREDIHGFTVNQMLTSSYFGLSSARALDTGTLTDLARADVKTNGVNGANGTTAEAHRAAADAESPAQAEAKARADRMLSDLLTEDSDA